MLQRHPRRYIAGAGVPDDNSGVLEERLRGRRCNCLTRALEVDDDLVEHVQETRHDHGGHNGQAVEANDPVDTIS